MRKDQVADGQRSIFVRQQGEVLGGVCLGHCQMGLVLQFLLLETFHWRDVSNPRQLHLAALDVHDKVAELFPAVPQLADVHLSLVLLVGKVPQQTSERVDRRLSGGQVDVAEGGEERVDAARREDRVTDDQDWIDLPEERVGRAKCYSDNLK